MRAKPAQRPEGDRTADEPSTPWALARQLIGLCALWVLTLYAISKAQNNVANAAAMTAIGCFVALIGGYGVEAIVMRKYFTTWLGSLLLAAWAWWLPFATPGTTVVVVGIGALAVVGATPGPQRGENERRNRSFLRAHPRWARQRRRLRMWLAAGMFAGLAAAIGSGLWRVAAGL